MASIERNPLRLMATCSADAPLKGLRYLLRAYARLLADHPRRSGGLIAEVSDHQKRA